jgi:drug/metabolite transporter (DMT)-like permease
MFAIPLAVGAAAVYGAATALQHHAASSPAAAPAVSGRLLGRLWRRPGWLLGLVLSGLAFALHVAALHRGPLTLVQPIVITTVVFAVLVRAGLDRTLPDAAEVVWCVCTWAGLALFLSTIDPRGPHPVVDHHAIVRMLVVGVSLAAVTTLAAGRTRAAPRGFLLGVAAGILYGLTAGLIKVATSYPPGPRLLPLEHWPTWLVLPMGLGAFLLSQWAYAATRLSVSVPTLNLVDVLTAVVFGSVVFGDHLGGPPWRLLLTVIGAATVGVSVWRLVKESERLHDRSTAQRAAGRPTP